MPIQTVKRGKQLFREAELGTGDVAICGSMSEGEGKLMDMLLLIQDSVNHEIGGNVDAFAGSTDKIEFITEPMSILFTKSASVRVVIEALEKIETELLEAGV